MYHNICNENVEKQKEALAPGKKATRRYVASRFSTVAVEMLVTNRYIDADKTFYETAEEYMDTLIRVNEQLPPWEYEPERTEKYLLTVEKHAKSFTGKFRTLVMKHKKAIETIL